MDQSAVVAEQTESGRRLIEALVADGFAVRLAFWAKPTEEGKWFLYLASPVVDEKGPATAYRLVLDKLRKTPELGVDPFDLRLIGMNDSMTAAVLTATKPKVPDSVFAVRPLRSYPGITWFGGSTLGGVSMDGAYVYPSAPPAASI